VTSLDSPVITIRAASTADELAIIRLAALDSAPVPRAPLVLAEVEGELRVAVSADDLAVVADPFQRTAELAALLREHVERTRPPAAPLERRGRSVAPLRGRRLRLT
jgi:hypothetical protein